MSFHCEAIDDSSELFWRPINITIAVCIQDDKVACDVLWGNNIVTMDTVSVTVSWLILDMVTIDKRGHKIQDRLIINAAVIGGRREEGPLKVS